MKQPFTHPLHLVTGFIIWSIWFITAYGGLSLACMAVPGMPGPLSGINIALLVFTVLTALLLLVLARRCWRAARNFNARIAATAYFAAAAATLAVGLPAIALPPCL